MNYFLVVFIGIIGAFYYNIFRWLVESWLNNQYYSHGFIVRLIGIGIKRDKN